MASIGLRYSVYAPLTENAEAGTFSYGTGKRGRKMIKADIKINYDDAKLRAEDGIGESLKPFVDGAITITQDELTPTMRTDLLGNKSENITIGEDTVAELSGAESDVSPYVGYGYIQSKIVDGVRQYRAVFYTKVQFAEPDESAETQGEKIAWQTPAIAGTLYKRVDGKWREEALFTPGTGEDSNDALAKAIAYLKDKVNLT
jgi:phi13 family phage major tail protein